MSILQRKNIFNRLAPCAEFFNNSFAGWKETAILILLYIVFEFQDEYNQTWATILVSHFHYLWTTTTNLGSRGWSLYLNIRNINCKKGYSLMTSNFGPQPGSPMSGLCKQPLTEPLSVTSFKKRKWSDIGERGFEWFLSSFCK